MEFKSAKIQVYLIGFFAFCGPGLFNALNGLGAAGSGDAKTAAVANGCLYASFAIFGYFSGVIINLIGPRMCFFFGGLSYAVYALCTFYTTPERIWLAAIGGLQLGLGAGMFWCAQSSLTMAYATASEKALFTTIFWVIFNLGGVFGGFLQMGLNWDTFSEENGGLYTAGGIRASTAAYVTFIVLMCVGAVVSFFVMVSPEKVVRSDGTRVEIDESITAKDEIKAAIKGFTEPFVVRMMLYFVFSNWFYTYEFGFLNGLFFNSRGQGMNSGLYWLSQMGGSLLFSYVAETIGKKKGWSLKKCLRAGFYLNVAFLVVSWVLALVVQYTACDGRVDKNNTPADQAIYGLLADGSTNDTNLSVLAWFPEQNGISGCDYLSGMRAVQEAGGNAVCEANTDCLNNILQCVPEGYYGRCYLDIVNTDEGIVCNAVDSSECMTVPLSFTSESILVIITFMIMGFSDAIFQVYCYFLMAKVARGSLRDSARYAAAYKGIQSAGAAIAWGTDYVPTFLYRYQSYVCVIFGALSCIGSWFSVKMIQNLPPEKENNDTVEGSVSSVAKSEGRDDTSSVSSDDVSTDK